MADDAVHPLDHAIYHSRSSRVAWIKADDHGWVLLPHGVPDLAVHLPEQEFITMLDRLRDML